MRGKNQTFYRKMWSGVHFTVGIAYLIKKNVFKVYNRIKFYDKEYTLTLKISPDFKGKKHTFYLSYKVGLTFTVKINPNFKRK